MEKYEFVGDGNFGVGRLMRNTQTSELVSVKFLERGHKIDEFVPWQILCHRSLRHPNIIQFKEVALTPTHIAIVMEHANGGAFVNQISNGVPFKEDEARYFFQQLISGVSYCHSKLIYNQDLALANTLLKWNPSPQLKICDFAYTKSLLPPSPQLTARELSHMAPEVLFSYYYRGQAGKYVEASDYILNFLNKVEQSRCLSQVELDVCIALQDHIQALRDAEADLYLRKYKWNVEQYDRQERHRPLSDDETNARKKYKEDIIMLVDKAELADVWSCGVLLYLMLVGTYAFQNPEDPKQTIERIMSAQYEIPDDIDISQDCQQLLARIFVADPRERIKIQEIREHPWFLKDLPEELSEAAQTVYYQGNNPADLQSKQEILRILNEARQLPPSSPQLQEEQVAPEGGVDWEMYVMPRER
ncbi:hypothetical protein LUZ63_000462 [Rhynchospora breviuscula]|uniref:non-specific serine/threonine protein kinase n=1 Tax=Rhynchospora breviuscula TaxID=2022672 RepID=A0A9Q0CVE4_9POAL|nr:hypothetical protein LUZ63_000462 [Rhynchospora breviuscula]